MHKIISKTYKLLALTAFFILSSGSSYGQDVILPELENDTAFHFKSFFITRKGKVFSIFDENNKPLSIKGLRTVYVKDNIQGIARNKHFVITYTGKVVYTKEKGWNREPELENNDPFNIYDIIPSDATSYYIEKKDDLYYIKNSDIHWDNLNYGMVYMWKPDIDSLYFPNKKISWYRQTSWDYFLNTKFLFNKNKKLGIGNFSHDQTLKSPFSIKTILPPIFDDIEAYADLDDIFNRNVDEDQRMFLYRDKLVGLFPIHSDVRYRKLRIYGEFARFILPSGKKGWLNTITGEEFLDE